ncbi:MAG: hypothetical protein ABIH59_01100 [archaeon]
MLSKSDSKFRELIERGIPLERLEMRLRPKLGLEDWDAERSQHDEFGDYSHEGFLGIDESLLDVIHGDWEVVERYGTTHQEIAEVLAKAIKTQEMPNPEYTIQYDLMTAGLQGCPWECKGNYQRGNGLIIIYNVQKTSQQDLMAVTMSAMIGDRRDKMELEMVDRNEAMASFFSGIPKDTRGLTDRVAVVTELHPHLIGEHYFFEGKYSPYRADPRVLIPALNLSSPVPSPK